MNENKSFELPVEPEQQESSEIETFLEALVPDSFCERKKDTLVVCGEMAFIRNIYKKRFEILEILRKDSRFEDITEPKTDSRLAIHAKVKEPENGISKVEIYVNKDM